MSLMKLFPPRGPLEMVAIDILGPLPQSSRGFRFILVMADRFTKLTQAVPLRRITAYDVAVAFVEHWVFKYGPPETLLSDNGSQFVAHFFQRVCKLLHTANVFTTTYHPQTNGQVERFNRSLTAMLRSYVDEHPKDWCAYTSALCYAYNMAVHRSTNTTPFELVLSRPPPEFTLAHSPRRRKAPVRETKEDYARRLGIAIGKARNSLLRTQQRYKRNFDARVRKTRAFKEGDHVFLELNDGAKKRSKLQFEAAGPFRVLSTDSNTVVIQRGDVVERVSRNRVTFAPAVSSRPAQARDPSPHDFATKKRTGDTWLFNSILAHREKPDGGLEFKVDWDGDWEPTWEPRDCVPEEAISRYFTRYRRAFR